jgi:hypothetical protein
MMADLAALEQQMEDAAEYWRRISNGETVEFTAVAGTCPITRPSGFNLSQVAYENPRAIQE